MIRQYFFDVKDDPDIKYKYLNYYAVYEKMVNEHNVDFYALCSNAAQNTLRVLDKNFASFFKLLCLKQTGQYTENVSIPKYLKKDGYFPIIINCINLNKKLIQEGILQIPNTEIQIKTSIANIAKQLRIVYHGNYIQIEIIYEKPDVQVKENNNRYISIDLGVNNLCAVSSNVIKSFIIDGKKIKHINQHWNKEIAKLQSKLPKNVYTSKIIKNKTLKRNNQIDTYLHKVSRILINHAVSNNINTIIIGKNKEWKQEIKMRKDTKQNFVQIPFNKLIQMIIYKAYMVGINVHLQEESYTSKCSFFDNDYIPTYGIDDDKFKPSGKRKYRGLYKANKYIVNADINGSLNILRKYLKCNCDEIISPADVGLVVNPSRVFIH